MFFLVLLHCLNAENKLLHFCSDGHFLIFYWIFVIYGFGEGRATCDQTAGLEIKFLVVT